MRQNRDSKLPDSLGFGSFVQFYWDSISSGKQLAIFFSTTLKPAKFDGYRSHYYVMRLG